MIQRRRSSSSILPSCYTSKSCLRATHDGEGEEEIVVTKEMFMRQMLQGDGASSASTTEVTVQKKNGKKGFHHQQRRNHDNRDILPFQVTLQTPDPYTHPEIKRRNAKKTSRENRANAVEEHMIPSKVYATSTTSSTDGSSGIDNTLTVLGEYQLDKHTTTGDVLNINDVSYKILRHRCQYKYAGGAKFVMVRKILEVKEMARLQTESYLRRQLEQSPKEEGEKEEGSL